MCVKRNCDAEGREVYAGIICMEFVESFGRHPRIESNEQHWVQARLPLTTSGLPATKFDDQCS